MILLEVILEYFIIYLHIDLIITTLTGTVWVMKVLCNQMILTRIEITYFTKYSIHLIITSLTCSIYLMNLFNQMILTRIEMIYLTKYSIPLMITLILGVIYVRNDLYLIFCYSNDHVTHCNYLLVK